MMSTCAWAYRGLRNSLIGCAAAIALHAEVKPEAPVELPPYLVETSNAPAWLYGSEPGVEMLSRCSRETTERVLHSIWHGDALFDAMLEGRFRAQRSLPVIVILCPQEWKPSLPPDAAELLHLPAEPEHRFFAPPVRFFPNLFLGSSDLHIIFFVEPGRVSSFPDVLTPAAAQRELGERLPPLPPWFVAGFAAHYGRAAWVGKGQAQFPATFDQLVGRAPSDAGSMPDDDDDSGELRLTAKPSEWTSADDAEAFRRDSDRPRWLLPLSELLADRPPTEPQREQVWRAESELFVRWMVTRLADGRHKLWQLAQAGAQAPMNEALFQRATGLDYSDAFDALSDFLPEAVSNEVDFPDVKLPDPPQSRVRRAKHGEITRLKAAWEEAEAEFIAQHYPPLLKAYISQAEATLDDGRRYGPDTPDTLAIRGLLAVDQGDDVSARLYLQAAINGRVVRPWAYFELAALRLREAKAHPFGSAGRLSASQARSVLEPLWQSRDQAPQALTAFVLAAEASSLSEEDPRGHFAEYLALGRSLYPKAAQLADHSRK